MKGTVRNAECTAKLRIAVKKIAAESDKFMKMDPPLTGVVRLDLQHSYNLTATAALGMLRTDEQVYIFLGE